MNLLRLKGFFVTYLRSGNDKNGNPVYLINFFDSENGRFYNCNYRQSRKLDKQGNIKVQSYCIEDNINSILKEITDGEK